MTKQHTPLPIPVIIEGDDPDLLPNYASSDAAGADVRAAIEKPILLAPGQRALISTGLKAAIPSGYEIQIRPRSGLAYKHGISIVNAPGTIDADYRGDIGVILINLGQESFTITPKMRIAQFVVAPVTVGGFFIEQQLTTTARGSGGFGHTGSH